VVLEHHRPLNRRPGNGRAVHANGAGAGAVEARDHVAQRRLAAARWPDQAHELALVDVQIDAVQRHDITLAPTKCLAHALDLYRHPENLNRASRAANHPGDQPKTVGILSNPKGASTPPTTLSHSPADKARGAEGEAGTAAAEDAADARTSARACSPGAAAEDTEALDGTRTPSARAEEETAMKHQP
jgi:hypothetical protein